MRLFHLEMIIDLDHLHELMVALEKYKASNVQVRAVEPERPRSPGKASGDIVRKYKHTKKRKNIEGLFKHLLTKDDQAVSRADVMAAMPNFGYNKSSIGTVMTRAIKKGIVIKTDRDQYKMGPHFND